jgi:hypothetical protein
LFTSNTITSIDLSAVGHYSPVFNDDEDSILNLCTSFEVGAVPVFDCPGFDFFYFAQQGGVELKRLKDFMGSAAFFPIIGYVSDCPPVRADMMPFSIFEHDIRAVYMRWRLGVEHAVSAHHLNHMHVLMFLKRWHEQVLRQRPKATQVMIQMLRQLHDACTLPVLSMRKAKAIVHFVKNAPASALMMLGSAGAKIEVLSHRIIDKPWKSAMLPDGVVCKLMDGLARLRMQDRYFDKIFDAYKAKGEATGEQASAIVRFERELSGGVGPFSEEGVASGNPCSAFALFSECRANDIVVDGSEGDDTLGDQWDGLSQEVKDIYAEVARNIVVGKQLSDLKELVEAKCTEQAAQRAPPQEEQQAGPLAAAAAAAANKNARAPDSDAAAAGRLQPLPQEEPADGQQPQEGARDQVQGQQPFSLCLPLSLSLSLYLEYISLSPHFYFSLFLSPLLFLFPPSLSLAVSLSQ